MLSIGCREAFFRSSYCLEFIKRDQGTVGVDPDGPYPIEAVFHIAPNVRWRLTGSATYEIDMDGAVDRDRVLTDASSLAPALDVHDGATDAGGQAGILPGFDDVVEGERKAAVRHMQEMLHAYAHLFEPQARDGFRGLDHGSSSVVGGSSIQSTGGGDQGDAECSSGVSPEAAALPYALRPILDEHDFAADLDQIVKQLGYLIMGLVRLGTGAQAHVIPMDVVRSMSNDILAIQGEFARIRDHAAGQCSSGVRADGFDHVVGEPEGYPSEGYPRLIVAQPSGKYADGTPIRPREFMITEPPRPVSTEKSMICTIEGDLEDPDGPVTLSSLRVETSSIREVQP